MHMSIQYIAKVLLRILKHEIGIMLAYLDLCTQGL